MGSRMPKTSSGLRALVIELLGQPFRERGIQLLVVRVSDHDESRVLAVRASGDDDLWTSKRRLGWVVPVAHDIGVIRPLTDGPPLFSDEVTLGELVRARA